MTDSIVELAKTFHEKHKSDLTLNREGSKWRHKLTHQSPVRWSALGYLLTPDDLWSAKVRDTEANFTLFYNEVFKLVSKDSEVQIPEHLTSCTIVTDVVKGVRWVKEEGGIKPWNFDTWKDQIPKEVYDTMFQDQENAVVVFNPFKNLSWQDDVRTTTGKESFTHYNLYVKPDWRFETPKTEYPLCEEYVRPFLEHLFPLEHERVRVVCWMSGVIKARRDDILLLVGTKGNGKGTFKDLISCMVGNENQMIAGSDFCKDKFNGEIAYKQFIRTDEFKVKGERKENLKKFSNDTISIERKGGDPVLVENFCSFAVANNYDESVEVDYNDRRFFVPQLSDQNLTEVWPEYEIGVFRAAIKTLEFQTELPYWLEQEIENNGVDYPGNTPYRTDRFYDLVETSKAKWWREFKNVLTIKQECTLEEIRTLTHQYRITDLKIKEMIVKEKKEREFIEKDRLAHGRDPGKYVPFSIATPVFEAGVGVKYVSHLYQGESSHTNEEVEDEAFV